MSSPSLVRVNMLPETIRVVPSDAEIVDSEERRNEEIDRKPEARPAEAVPGQECEQELQTEVSDGSDSPDVAMIESSEHPQPPEVRLNAQGLPDVGHVPVYAEVMPNTIPKSNILVRKWPSLMMQLMNDNDDDEWWPVMERIETHPEEITIQGNNGGQNALHAACVRYPPSHVVQAMLQVKPEAALQQNFSGETPLHLASFSASEEVQEMLVRAAPMAVAAVDQYGDCPLHAAARLGATLPLMESMLQAAPRCVSLANKRGVAPFWLLPRSYLEAEDLEEILDEDADDDYKDDWDLMVLTLRYAYFGTDHQPPVDVDGNPVYDWLVHAAAATPSCPHETLKFLCGLFPEQAIRYDHNGNTPLLLAVQAPVVAEPKHWDETEDGFREHVEVAEVTLHDSDREELPTQATAAQNVDTEYLEQALQESAGEQEAEETVVSILVEWDPRSLVYADAEQRLPLAHALSTGKPWRIVRKLIQACPRALESRDYKSKLYMFQLAAMNSDLDTVFNTVRSLPELMGMARRCEDRRGPATEERPTKQARSVL